MSQTNRFSGTLFDLAGKTALITGGSRGIGRAISERFAQHGANVVIAGRKKETADLVANLINERDGGRAVAAAANITKKDDLNALVDVSMNAFGKVDILVTNAALHIHVGPSADMTDPILEKTMDANFRALHLLTQKLLPGMLERHWGRIINIGSIAAHYGTGIYHSYTLTKSLGMQYTRNIAVEHGEAGIRANNVSPGLIQTDMAQGLLDNPKELAAEMARSTVGRFGQPDEIAGVVLMLACDAGSYVNGQTIAVDGGQTIRYVS